MLLFLPTHHQILVKSITFFVSHTCGPFRSRNISCKQFRLGPQYMSKTLMYKKSYVEYYVDFLTILCITMTILIVVPQYYIPMISMQTFCCLILFCTNYNAQSSEEFNLLKGYYKT